MDRLDEVRRLVALRLLVRLDALRLLVRLEPLRLDALREDDFRLGTLAPERRASDSPMAIACLRLLARLPARPLFSLPRLYSCIALPTFFLELVLYFAMVAPLAVHSQAARRRYASCNDASSLALWIAHYLHQASGSMHAQRLDALREERAAG